MVQYRPIIGIPCSLDDSESRIKISIAYFNAVFGAGGNPVFLPYNRGAQGAEQIAAANAFDGILFSGGVDVNPSFYGEKITGENVQCSWNRDEFEMALFREICETNIPVLGICRGVQSLNVFYGGTLHQHITGHRQSESGRNTPYTDRVIPGTMLSDILGGKTETHVNSFHHQAVKDVAPGFIASAYSEEGYVEAIEAEDRSRFLLGVQWHPEIFFGINEDSDRVFAAFIEAARAYHAGK